MHGHLANAARDKAPVVCSRVFDFREQRVRQRMKAKTELKKRVIRDMIFDVNIRFFCSSEHTEMNLKIEGDDNHGGRGCEFIELCCGLHQ